MSLPPPPEQPPQAAQNVFLINLGVFPVTQTDFVTSPPHASPLHWTIVPHSLPLLSWLLPRPLTLPPPSVPSLPQRPAVITLEETTLAEGVCIDLQRLAKQSPAEEAAGKPVERPKEQLVRSREGVRMVYLETVSSVPVTKAEKPAIRLRVEMLIDCHEMICDTLLRTPFMVLVAKAPAFTQFMRSLVMDHRLAFGVVENEGERVDTKDDSVVGGDANHANDDADTNHANDDADANHAIDDADANHANDETDANHANTNNENENDTHTNQPTNTTQTPPKPLTFLLFPFTNTTAYLFLPNGAGNLSGFTEATCDAQGSTDLVYWWTQALEKSGTPQVLPGDLLAYNSLRKAQPEERKQEEDPFIAELREKLEMADLEKASKAEGLLHVGDLKVLLRAQLEEA